VLLCGSQARMLCVTLWFTSKDALCYSVVHKQGCFVLLCGSQARMLCVTLWFTSKDALCYSVVHKQGCFVLLCGCVRDAEGGETSPSFGHPSNVRRGKGATAFGGEQSEVPKGSLLIGGKGG